MMVSHSPIHVGILGFGGLGQAAARLLAPKQEMTWVAAADQRGFLYDPQGLDPDQAIATYKKIPAGDANADKATIEIGMTLLEKNDLAGAEATLSTAAQSTSANKEVFYALGEVMFAKGSTDEAVKHYERASEIDPNWGKPLFKLGLAKLQKADTAGTIAIMEKLIQVDPNSAEAAQAKALVEQLKKQ